MREFLKHAVMSSGMLRLAAGLRARGAAILMYHSVLDEPLQSANFLGDTAHSCDVFRAQMELLSREFHPVSLDQVAGFVAGKTDLPSRAVAVTFDDGYADNFEVVAPILRELGIPATFYVTVDCIERRELPWPARLRFAFRTTRSEPWLSASGKTFSLKTPEDRERAYLHACELCCRLSGTAQREFVCSRERELETASSPSPGMAMMTPDQLRGLRQEGHIVASHTMTHPNVAQLAAPEAQYELSQSKLRLEAMLGKPVRHFSYPCPALWPHWTEQTAAQCAAAGYETSVTTLGGLAKKGDNLQLLKRVRPTKTLDGLRWNLECAFAGRAV